MSSEPQREHAHGVLRHLRSATALDPPASALQRAVDELGHHLARIVTDGALVVTVRAADGTRLWHHEAPTPPAPAGESDGDGHVSSYSAPIRTPDTGSLLGVLELSTTGEHATPLALSVASLLATSISLLTPDGATDRLGQDGLRLTTLGTVHATLDGAPVRLAPRQLEILVVMSLHPDGLSLHALHAALFRDDLHVKPATVRAEVSHLRRRLDEAIGSRPYRLEVPVTADHLRIVDHLRHGRLASAIELYGGELLPDSEAPAVREHSTFVETALRHAVQDAGDADLLFTLGERMPYEVALHERTLRSLEPGDARRAIVRARLAAIRA